MAAICLAGFRVPAGKPASQSANALSPFSNCLSDLLKIGDAPLRAIAYQ